MTDRDTLIAPLLQDYEGNPTLGIRVYREVLAHDAALAHKYGIANIPEVHVNLGLFLIATGEQQQAELAYRQAIALAPKNIAALYNLGCLFLQQRRAREAELTFEQVLAIDQTHANAALNLANAKRDLMQRDEAHKWAQQAEQLAPSNYLPASFALFEACYDPASTDASIFANAKRVADLRANGLQTRTSMPPCEGKHSLKPLKIGFVSGDFKSHPVGFFLLGCLPFIDRTRLSLHAFSMFEREDYASQKLRSEFETWDIIAGLSDDAASQLIATRQIDVLIDLSGHTDMNRLPLFICRAAPVQMSWLGWYATTGVVNMDYFLTDPISSPKSSQSFHTEHLLYLPETRFCMAQPQFAPPVSLLPALQNKHFTFGSFQSLLKITDVTLTLWRQVLAAIPDSALQVCCSEFRQHEVMTLFRARLAQFEIAQGRVTLLPPVNYHAYFESYQKVDLVLDTLPFSGGTTTVEALWMGVPTLTMLGSTLIARQGASLMSAAGLPDWVCESQADYVNKALYWSKNASELAALRLHLREKVRASPLFDGERFAADFSDAIETAYNSRLLLQPLREL